MIILDIFFKICFAPFQKVKNGRTAAVIPLIQIGGFTLVAIINALLYLLGLDLSAISLAFIGFLASTGVYLLFNKIYVRNNREVGVVRFPFLMGVLIFVLLLSSAFLMIFSAAKY